MTAGSWNHTYRTTSHFSYSEQEVGRKWSWCDNDTADLPHTSRTQGKGSTPTQAVGMVLADLVTKYKHPFLLWLMVLVTLVGVVI